MVRNIVFHKWFFVPAENCIDATRKELTDTRRMLGDSNIERDKYANSNKELRDHVKRVEGQRREQARSMDDALQKIAGKSYFNL